MTFADKYSKHAYADLIREAETQGIGLGVQAERERICRIIDANVCKCTEDCTRIDMFGDDLIALIRGERVAHLENLHRLADETGEYDSFYNPLIKGDDK